MHIFRKDWWKGNKKGSVMDIKNKYALELQDIANDLEILKNGLIYEIQNTPGTPSVPL